MSFLIQWLLSLLSRTSAAARWFTRLFGYNNKKEIEDKQDDRLVQDKERPKLQKLPVIPFDGLCPNRSNVITGGSTGLVYLLSSGYVRKSIYPDSNDQRQCLRDIEREYQIYMRLPQHERLLRMIAYHPDDGITLEYMPKGSLKDHLESGDASITLVQRLQWACDAAEALHFVHLHGVIHSDLKPENLLLDSKLRLRLIDFSGSSMDGSYSSALESARYFLPRPWKDPSTVATDLFALGSTIYYILTSRPPYEEQTEEEVEALFEQGIFPLLDEVICGNVIQGCWKSEIHSAEVVFTSITIELRKVDSSLERMQIPSASAPSWFSSFLTKYRLTPLTSR